MHESQGKSESILYLWAKLGDDPASPTYHPLLFHMIDAAAVAEALWERGLSQRMRSALSGGLGMDPSTAARWIALLVALHDLGKATPAFQYRLPKTKRPTEQVARQHVERAGFPPPPSHPTNALLSHGEALSVVLPDLLVASGLPNLVAKELANALAGHHGRFPLLENVVRGRTTVGDGPWLHARKYLFELLRQLLGVHGQPPNRAEFAALVLLAGLTTVADWIASIEKPYFPHEAVLGHPPTTPAEVYLDNARRSAFEAVAELRWQMPERLPPRPFHALFPQLPSIRPLQRATERLADRLKADEPALVVIEAPTGEGKTEAAWLLADRWGIVGPARGVYVAMPTRATSDALFGRVREALANRYVAEEPREVVLQLVHGHAALSAELQLAPQSQEEPQRPGQLWQDAVDAERPDRAAIVVAGDWFTYRKRGLLAPFGVGTVDQVFLGALRIRHSVLRLFGLAGRAVIFDEVHAYDTYMLALFERVLEWLAALRSSVIVLSATLPRSRREALMKAFLRGLGTTMLPGELRNLQHPYPRITVVTPSGSQVTGFEASTLANRSIRVEIRPTAPDPEGFAQIGRLLAQELESGGCAVVVCNTVRQAQMCYRALQPFFPHVADDDEPELDLLHARFPFLWRQEREIRTLRRFGKPDATVSLNDGSTSPVKRPRRAVLVSTQIVEQSLDLDFDLLVTMPAPIDLLLQRAGRLHRHQRENRPPSLAQPRLWLVGLQLTEADLPIFDRGTLAVYDAHVLLRTWLALRARPVLELPSQIDELIASVYDEADPPTEPAHLRKLWEDTKRELEKRCLREQNEAAKRWVCPPGDGRLEELTDADLVEDEGALEVHPTFRAITRLADPTATLIPLYATEQGLALDPEGRNPVDPSATPSTREAAKLLAFSVSVSGQRLLEELRATSKAVFRPDAWLRSPLLAHVFAARFDPQGRLPLAKGTTLQLDRELGLVIQRREETYDETEL